MIFKIKIIWLCWACFVAHRLSLVVVSGGYSWWWWLGFLLQWHLLLQSTCSRALGFSSCGMQAQQLCLMGLVDPQDVTSSSTKDQTYVPCIGRWLLILCTSREVQPQWFFPEGKDVLYSYKIDLIIWPRVPSSTFTLKRNVNWFSNKTYSLMFIAALFRFQCIKTGNCLSVLQLVNR